MIKFHESAIVKGRPKQREGQSNEKTKAKGRPSQWDEVKLGIKWWYCVKTQ